VRPIVAIHRPVESNTLKWVIAQPEAMIRPSPMRHADAIWLMNSVGPPPASPPMSTAGRESITIEPGAVGARLSTIRIPALSVTTVGTTPRSQAAAAITGSKPTRLQIA
jgi:hypothetical protein